MNLSPDTRTPSGLTLHIVESGNSRTLNCETDIVAEIGTEISFDPSILDAYHYTGWKAVHHDLLLICAAVEYADRRRARRSTRWSRDFRIKLPVIELDAWEQPDVSRHLEDTLRHLTGDDWQFFFRKATDMNAGRLPRQRPLPYPNNKGFVMAYSNGLDSRCVAGIIDPGDCGVRVRMTRAREHGRTGERPFDRMPFAVKVESAREGEVRSRGFKFAALTAIAGHLARVERVIVPESGQGAIGPFLRPLHNSYPDYRSHPSFLRKMEEFIGILLGCSIYYEQPRIWNTKGETVSEFLIGSPDGADGLFDTRSCWQQRWNARSCGRLRQCGLCAACMLRRMSMYAAQLKEPAGTYVFEDLSRASFQECLPTDCRARLSRTMLEYGSVGASHLQQLAEMAELPDEALRPYVHNLARSLGDLEDETGQRLRRLLVQHASEWRAFCNAQGQRSFFVRWSTGAHDG